MNLTTGVAGLVIGACLGALLQWGGPWLLGRYRQVRAARARRRGERDAEETAEVYSWLVDYYEKGGHASDLYDCRIGECERRIPFLTKTSWLPSGHNASPVGTVVLAPGPDTAYPVDFRAIRERSRRGQRLFNGSTCYVDRIQAAPGGLTAWVKKCRYYEVLTSMIRLEEETYEAKRRGRATPLRDKVLSSVADAGRIRARPNSLGCSFLMAFRTDTGFEIMLHQRSLETATFGGVIAGTPNFGFEPLEFSKADQFWENFVKEYLEELFNYEDLIDTITARRADPGWFRGLPEAIEINLARESGAFQVFHLGMGVDALNGNFVIGALGVVRDPALAFSIRQRVVLNWEAHVSTSHFEFVRSDSPVLEQWLREGRYHTGAAFALAQALPRLNGFFAPEGGAGA